MTARLVRPVESGSLAALLPARDAADPERSGSRILETWRRHPVLIFRGCALTPIDLLRFSRLFGRPVPAPPQTDMLEPDALPPEIMVVSNILRDGRPIGHLGGGELAWHTDMCYTAVPAVASALYAVEVPPQGGDTWFMDMVAAYAHLPDHLRRLAEILSCKHDDSCTAAGDLRHGRSPVTDVSVSSGAIHPLVKFAPDSGRHALYLGRRLNAYLIGMDVAESEALLDVFWQHCLDQAVTFRHQWQTGDLVVWDNRVTMHRRDPVPQAFRRLMWRAQMRPL
jgi:taurine dioxygenase